MRVKEKFDSDKLFFTSDTRFQHKNVINFCNRPYSSVEEMNEKLIENWNSVVPKDGVVFHLGDLVFTADIGRIKHLREQLNGTIYLIMGNHDYQNRLDREEVMKIFDNKVYDQVTTIVNNVHLQMTHHPIALWNRGYLHLYGHLHTRPNNTSSERLDPHPHRYDVGVDNNNYRPISFNELIDKMDEIKLSYYLK